jgi:hypothetical protein
MRDRGLLNSDKGLMVEWQLLRFIRFSCSDSFIEPLGKGSSVLVILSQIHKILRGWHDSSTSYIFNDKSMQQHGRTTRIELGELRQTSEALAIFFLFLAIFWPGGQISVLRCYTCRRQSIKVS